jgi:hypothetical protein
MVHTEFSFHRDLIQCEPRASEKTRGFPLLDLAASRGAAAKGGLEPREPELGTKAVGRVLRHTLVDWKRSESFVEQLRRAP